MNIFNRVALLSIFGVSFYSIAEQEINNPNVQKNDSIDIAQITEHTVTNGDNLFSIANQYHVSIEQLKIWNNITNAHNLKIGQRLIVSQTSSSLKVQAEKAIQAKKYGLATRLLNRLYKTGITSEQAFALEYLGVVREKKGQLTFAKQAYETFLVKYPHNTNIERVKIRLNNIIGIENLTKKQQLKSGKRKNNKPKAYNRGSVATDYRRSMLVNDIGESRDTLSLATVDVDAKGNAPLQSIDLGYRISVGHYQDLLPNSNKTTEQIRYLNVSAKSHNDLYQFSIGRQRSRGKGIFGRFDGVVLSTQPWSSFKFNLTAGYPVSSSKVTSLDPERKFYGLSVDVENSVPGLNLSAFYFNQTINNLTDRRAVGGQLSYFKNNASLYSLIDYDIFFKQLNALLFSGSYQTASLSRYSWSFNYRKSPYVGTRNALIGQPVDSLAELRNLFITDEEILDLAVDRTLTSKTASFQYSTPINKKFDLNTSLTWMDLSGAPESGGVSAIADSGAQIYSNIYIGAKNLFSHQDYSSLGLRYSKLTSGNIYSIYATSKYKFGNGLSLTPKLRFDSRTSDNGTSQQNISPSLRLQYQSKSHYLYTDLGGIFYNAKSTMGNSQKTNIYYLYLGYRYYF